MCLDWGREICGNLPLAESHEWLCTNGIGGSFTLAHLRVYTDAEGALAFLDPIAHHLADYGVGSIAEIFDGDPPFTSRGCIAQAWSVSEALRAWMEIAGQSHLAGS